ncbi:cell division protein FtsQ/DivIB [Aquisalimonas asiatica]|uniref:Cell division protein FtsQ n=1 Tax=Aquisalimonas asiatica TaxID=406100 RepID=A0A1H8S7C1_9GAMM|nr:cell division protein FtsQ/DivIB [Aquisalimonas asiatica]SEO74620.1 cell division protein FtsQ [Aquisalimonas asiatica]
MKRQRATASARRRGPVRRPVDPAVRAERRARVLLWLRRSGLAGVAAAGVGGAVWGTAWLLAPETFPLESVHFDSRLEHVREGDLRDALDGRLNDGFWALDVDGIRRALEALPWVDRAAVRRVWPGQLRVEIREQEAVAVWNDEALLGASGDVFAAPEDTWPEGLPALSGPDGRESDVAERYRELQRAVAGIGFGVERLGMDDRESWTAELDSGARIRLGREDVADRLERFVAAYPGLVREREEEMARADLRYPNGFSVRWRDDGNNAPN